MEKGNNLTKYIVYLTTNLVNNKIYIGVHKTTDPYKFDGYLGCGIYANDKHSYLYNKNPLGKAVTKYGPNNFIRVTLKIFDTRLLAENFERDLVNKEFINRSDTYNAIEGGGSPPITTKLIYQYELTGKFIKEWNSITDASIYYKCSSSSIGRAVLDKTPSKGFLWSDLKTDNLDIDEYNINMNCKTIYMYDVNGNYLKSFSSIAECAKSLNTNRTNISQALHSQYSFKKQFYFSQKKYKKFPKINQNFRMNPIYQYSLDGKFIRMWNSISQASTELKINQNCISVSIRKHTSAGNFLWKREKYDSIPPFKNKTKAKKVGKYSIEGELLQTFNTVTSLKKLYPSAANALYGRQDTAYGYVWKFLD